MRTLPEGFAAAVREAAGRPDVIAKLAAVYGELDATIAAKSPRCVNRGACCRFDEYGHELFVTTLEAAWFLSQCPDGRVLETPPNEPGCPYQLAGTCTARQARPTGCRIFFCDENSRDWQGPLTEESLARLKALHAELNVPYYYAEWRAALRACRE